MAEAYPVVRSQEKIATLTAFGVLTRTLAAMSMLISASAVWIDFGRVALRDPVASTLR